MKLALSLKLQQLQRWSTAASCWHWEVNTTTGEIISIFLGGNWLNDDKINEGQL
jgi:hypothetical protein